MARYSARSFGSRRGDSACQIAADASATAPACAATRALGIAAQALRCFPTPRTASSLGSARPRTCLATTSTSWGAQLLGSVRWEAQAESPTIPARTNPARRSSTHAGMTSCPIFGAFASASHAPRAGHAALEDGTYTASPRPFDSAMPAMAARTGAGSSKRACTESGSLPTRARKLSNLAGRLAHRDSRRCPVGRGHQELGERESLVERVQRGSVGRVVYELRCVERDGERAPDIEPAAGELAGQLLPRST